MKLLKVPSTREDMTTSLSLTGVTILRQYSYKQRHGGCKDIIQLPTGKLITKREYLRQEKERMVPTKPKKRSTEVIIKKKSLPGKVKKYIINKKEVIHRIRNYVNMMKGEKLLYFWTISFPKGTPDNIGMILLNKWLTRLRQEKMLAEYLWVSERQENGTIHYHMVINKRMCVKRANKYMRASIMHCINNKEIDYSRIAAKNYNGVDIAKNRKTKRVINFASEKNQRSLSNYLTKYITKNDTSFNQLAWHNSREYSSLITAIRFTSKEWNNSYQQNLVNKENPIIHEYYTFYRWKSHPPPELLKYLHDVNNHIHQILNL